MLAAEDPLNSNSERNKVNIRTIAFQWFIFRVLDTQLFRLLLYNHLHYRVSFQNHRLRVPLSSRELLSERLQHAGPCSRGSQPHLLRVQVRKEKGRRKVAPLLIFVKSLLYQKSGQIEKEMKWHPWWIFLQQLLHPTTTLKSWLPPNCGCIENANFTADKQSLLNLELYHINQLHIPLFDIETFYWTVC